MDTIDKLLDMIEELKDFDTWKEFKNDPEWVNKKLKETEHGN
jgi:hypothetical protein